MEISVVIPVFNEEGLINELFERTTAALSNITKEFEIICVDDGSTDSSFIKMMECNKKDKRFKVLQLARNFGHQPAYTAGLTYAKGAFTVMLDGDLQDPPELIPELYKEATQGNFDVVYGLRTERQEKFLKAIFIKSFHFVFKKMSNINVPINAGNFSIINRKALNELLKLEENIRYLPGLRSYVGFEQGHIEYTRPDRPSGEAKMTFLRLLNLAFDAIFSFSDLPIKFSLYLGFIGIITSIALSIFALTSKLFGIALYGWTSLLLSIFFIGFVQLFFLGIIGEYIYRIYRETQKRQLYIVKDFIE